MKKGKKKAAKTPEERGPKPDLLKLDGSWGAAIKKTLVKKKPPEGWPRG